MRYTFLTDFNMTTEIDGQYYSEFMSESDAFEIDNDGLYCELEDIQITSDTTAILFIEGYGSPMEIDLDGLIDEDSDETIEDFIIKNY